MTGGFKIIYIFFMYSINTYRVFLAKWNKVNVFFGQKNYFSSLKFYFLKKWKWDIYEYLKKKFKDKILCLKKPRILGAWNRQFSTKGGGISCGSAFLGICEVILRSIDLIFCLEPHISICFTDIKSFLIISTQKIRSLPLKMA